MKTKHLVLNLQHMLLVVHDNVFVLQRDYTRMKNDDYEHVVATHLSDSDDDSNDNVRNKHAEAVYLQRAE